MRIRITGVSEAPKKIPAPTTISVAIMAGNEAHFIADAIRSVAWADEVVLLDTGSTDGTGHIAESLGAKVTREPWRMKDLGDDLRSIDDFADARNRAMSLATSEWVFVLDADERVDAPRMRELLEQLPDVVDAVTLLHIHEGNGTAQVMPNIYSRSSQPRYEHRLHETLDTWFATKCRATAHIPMELGYVMHLGAGPEFRKKHRREERNRRVLELMLAEDPNDKHALYYMERMKD